MVRFIIAIPPSSHLFVATRLAVIEYSAQSNLRKKGYIWSPQLEVTVHCGGKLMATDAWEGSCSHCMRREQRALNTGSQLACYASDAIQDTHLEMVLFSVRVGLPNSIKLTKKMPQSCTQRLVFSVSLVPQPVFAIKIILTNS